MTDRRRTTLIFLVLYPFGWGAMAINAFFASLLASWAGATVFSPLQSCLVGALVAMPATWLFATHITRLMARAAPPVA
jgi:hypothetical protein